MVINTKTTVGELRANVARKSQENGKEHQATILIVMAVQTAQLGGNNIE